MKIILASKSPRRKELLEQIGLDFEIMVSDADEELATDVPHKLVEELSARKALAVMDELMQLEGGALEGEAAGRDAILVIGADTVVSIDGRILGKPKNEEEAVKMLGALSGRTHQVYTGVTLLYRPAGTADSVVRGAAPIQQNRQTRTFHEKTEVTFFPMTKEEIAGYVATGDCMDKAGAYGIQGLCARYIKGIFGDYSNVVGLPVGRLYQEAADWLEKAVAE